LKVTIKDVALHAGVSIATVSNVLAGKDVVKERTRNKVLNSVKVLGYYPNIIAQTLKGRATDIIGVLASDISNPFFPPFLRAVEDIAMDYGFSVLLCNTDDNPEKELTYLKIMESRQVTGIITTVLAGEKNLEYMKTMQLPLVCLNPVPRELGWSYIETNDQEAWYQATQHLLDRGYRKIGFLGGNLDLTLTMNRFLGYRDCLEDNGFAIRPEHIHLCKPTVLNGSSGMLQLLTSEDKIDAVVIPNGVLTLGAVIALRKSNFSFPEDIAVVGFLENREEDSWYHLVQPSLTVIAYSPYESGKKVMGMMLDRLNNGTQRIEKVEYQFIHGDST
jgi:DNA-binding LacI/PurR family transcriptional regulator